MLSRFVDDGEKSGTAAPSFSDSAGEDELVLAAKDGKEQAFEILVKATGARYLRSPCSPRASQRTLKTSPNKAFKMFLATCSSLKGNRPSPLG
jgi:hypothetical protein